MSTIRSFKRAIAALAAASIFASMALPVAAQDRDDHRHPPVGYKHSRDDRGGFEHQGQMFRDLPRGYRTHDFHGRRYYFHGGHYYLREPRGFVLVRPPIGFVIATLPFGYATVTVGGYRYFAYGGAYYRAVPAGYEVVTLAPPQPVAPASAVQQLAVQVPRLNVRSGPGL